MFWDRDPGGFPLWNTIHIFTYYPQDLFCYVKILVCPLFKMSITSELHVDARRACTTHNNPVSVQKQDSWVGSDNTITHGPYYRNYFFI